MPHARRLTLLPLALIVVCALVAWAAAARPSAASTPASHDVALPAAGQSTTVSWTGTIPPGANPTSDCSSTVLVDSHAIKLAVPAGAYATATSVATFKIEWSDPANDEILTVSGPDGVVGSSDGSGNAEIVTANDPKGGAYTADACGFASGPQDYKGSLTITTTAGGEVPPPSADPKGLAFSASVPSDPQRDVSEPLMETDLAGRTYTCGPTGFSNASDYANVSTDGGDQFHLLGTAPRGQQGEGGGGDCGLATAPVKNEQGDYQYAYAGLGPLTGFTTSTSPDGGRTLFSAGPQGNTNSAQGGGADRQWLTFLDATTVLLNYNQQRPRNVVVQKSTDGGQTYLTGNDTIAAGNPDFPGPMHSMPASLLTAGAPGRVAFFGWNSSDAKFSYVNFAISDASGLVWKNCVAQKLPLDQTGGLQAFTVADNDDAGNIYLSYAEEKSFHTYLTTLTVGRLKGCNEAPSSSPPTVDPGWSAPVQVDRGAVRTTIFPWLVAQGAPGRVAFSYYGTETDGDPNPGTFKASWDVYVDQSTNALDPGATFSQVKATTHPIHYDSICLKGLGCDLATPPGDRSLGDFFAIDLDHVTHKLQLVYDNTAKRPDDAAGRIAAPMVVTQTGGPSNAGGTVDTGADRAALRTGAADPAKDALVDYSSLNPTPTAQAGGTPGSQTNVPALDLLDEQVGAEIDPATGAKVTDGGFTVKLKLADLSSGALQSALQASKSGSLVYVFRFANGYTAAGAVAKWSPASGFSFGFDDYTTGSQQCGGSGDKCEIYPGNTPIKGKVDQSAGTITLSVPRERLKGLTGPTSTGQRPQLTKAVPGTRFYDAAAFTFANPSPEPATQSFMTPADNVRSMDFVLPGGPVSPATTATGAIATRGAKRCTPRRGFTSVGVKARGARADLRFKRRVRARARVDVFQVSRGRAVLDERLVARFTNRRTTVRWNGKANRKGRRVTDGYYFVRYRVRDGSGTDVRRVVLRRSRGRFTVRPAFYARRTCALVASYKLVRPVFGGRRNRAELASFILNGPARVTVEMLRGTHVVKRVSLGLRRQGSTNRVRFAGTRRPAGDYTFRLSATPPRAPKQVKKLTARRL